MDPAAISPTKKNSLLKRNLIAIPLFLILVICYAATYVFAIGLLMWGGKGGSDMAAALHCGTMPGYIPYYVIIFWPAVMFIAAAIPSVLIYLQKKSFWVLIGLFAGMCASSLVLMVWFMFIEIYCG
ncbi:MAG: hypothetical protein ABI528_00975 [bacterium]